MNVLLIVLLVSLSTALVVAGLGYLVGVKRQHQLINGVDFSSLTDVNKFGRILGNSMMLSGLLMALSGLLAYYQLISLIGFLVLFCLVSLLPVWGLIYARRKCAAV
ncbi:MULTISPECIES: DUF3784 domain-containing protein [Rheinheimera]|uniref:DUF3784 domain-containing protein n=1 Tax=Rheinheimera marina TaxID=1774958 RepID=A0ABV9JMQ0_9GAMM